MRETTNKAMWLNALIDCAILILQSVLLESDDCNFSKRYKPAYKTLPQYMFAVVTIKPAPGGGVRAASHLNTKTGLSLPSLFPGMQLFALPL